MASILQEFLQRQLIDISDDDQQLKSMESAAKSLAKTLQSKKGEIIPATLVALDSRISEEDPWIDATWAALKKAWRTAPARYDGVPITELRAILADALARAAKSDRTAASVFWLTAASYAPFAAPGREREVWTDLLGSAGRAHEQAAQEFWGDGRATAAIELVAPPPPPAANAPQLDATLLAKHLRAGAGPRGGDAGNIQRNAAYNFQQNHQQNDIWVEQFGTIASAGIATVVNTALAKVVEVNSAAALAEWFGEVRASLQTSLASVPATALRTQLLWWREAGYSPLLEADYSDVEPALLPLAMALDLDRQVPDLCPRSVDTFLGRVVRSELQGRDGDTRWSLDGFLDAMVDAVPDPLTKQLPRGKPREGRTTLLDLIRRSDGGEAPDGDLRDRLGVEGSIEVEAPTLARWLFRDLKAERLASGK